MQEQSSIPLNTIQLKKLRVKAIRAGVWFRVLPRIDRVLIDLTIKVTANIRSSSLAKCIATVVGKLEELTESTTLKEFRQFGLSLARQISDLAQKLGYAAAKVWANDVSFAAFLTVMQTNR
jgi:hypothetical protein